MSDLTPEERFKFEHKQAIKELEVSMERYRRILDGKEKAEDAKEIAQAHYFLAMDYEFKKDYTKTLYHIKELQKVYKKLGLLESSNEYKYAEEWIERIEHKSKD